MKNITFFLLVVFLFISCKKEPVASFEVSGSTSIGGTLLFENHSSHASSYLWDFGDYTTSTLSTPTHIFEKPGSYVVMLTVKGDGGTAFTDKTITITGTTYSFSNNSSYDLPQFCSYYWDGTNILDFVEHGILSVGHQTDIIITHRTGIEAGFIENDVVYIMPEPFPITTGQHNNLVITDETPVYSKKAIVNGPLEEQIRQHLQKR
jgi:PKD repeat protein